MMISRSASRLETTMIALVCLCLPLFEAPKNVFSLMFLLVWLYQLVQTKSLGSKSPFDVPILGLAAVLWASPLLSSCCTEVTPLNSAPRWTLLALFVVAAIRLDYSRTQILIVWAALLLGGIAAVVESFWTWHFNARDYPEFRSVGHVNHSSMYSLVTLAAGLGALHLRNHWLFLLGTFAIASTFAFLLPSRSLVGGVAIAAVLSAAISFKAVRKLSYSGLFFSIFAGVALVSVVLMTPPAEAFRSELIGRISGDNIFSGRDRILNSALAVWDQNPLLGTGWFSFGEVTSEAAVRAALAVRGGDYDPNVYWHYPHGHNLWTTMLIERGLVGVLLVTLLLFLYFRTFLPISLSRERLDPVDRAAAVGALLVAVGFVVAGLGNTTMMNEHGHAGMAFIAVAYGYLRGRGEFT